MWDVVTYLLWITLLAAALFAGGYSLKAYLSGTTPLALLLAPRPLPRLDVVDHSNVDGKRRLLLVRRDNVEHLIMTGGPVDVVIETGIPIAFEDEAVPEVAAREAVAPATGSEPLLQRPAKMFRRAVGEN